MDICAVARPGEIFKSTPKGNVRNNLKVSTTLKGKSRLQHIFYQWYIHIKEQDRRIGKVKITKANSSLELKYRKKQLPFPLGIWTPLRSKKRNMTVKLKRQIIINQQRVKLPKTWNSEQSHSCNLFDVSDQSEEYKLIKNTFMETMEGFNIIRIQRIQNLIAYQRYYSSMLSIGSTTDPNEKFLFHGTRCSSPSVIVCDQIGFDERMSGNQNLWGKGIYFAEDANYVDHFCFRSSPSTKQMIVASVLLGECFNYHTMCNPSLKYPPLNINTGERYHSISGKTNGSKIYAVYNSAQCCPRYIISYENKKQPSS